MVLSLEMTPVVRATTPIIPDRGIRRINSEHFKAKKGNAGIFPHYPFFMSRRAYVIGYKSNIILNR